MDDAERDRIREQYETEPGKAVHVERAVNELDNALAYGHESDEARARAELAAAGYTPADERARAEAAEKRREARAAAKSDAKDDDGKLADKTPAGRQSPAAKKQTAR